MLSKRALSVCTNLLLIPVDAIVVCSTRNEVVFAIAVQVGHDNGNTGVLSHIKIGMKHPLVTALIFYPSIFDNEVALPISIYITETKAMALIITYFVTHEFTGAFQFKIMERRI